MGKSPASCFKIISCAGAGDSLDHGDLQSPESKGSSDRSKWSFRKRSARHRILSNNVGSEAPLSANKEHQESPAVSCQVQSDLTVPEKTSVIQLSEEKTEFPPQLESKLSDTLSTREDDCKADETVNEPSIIIIQAGIRRLLAEQVLLKQRNIIKLQAAVRGHIVRRHAVGTLRCVQSIIKMQALVRARRAGRLGQVSGDSLKQSEISGKDNNDPMLLEAKSNAIHTYVSIEKLISNAFARQLMDSIPRTKPINIKCDPAKSDTAWKWLERWMSVSSVSNEGSQESGATEEHHMENLVHSDDEEDILALSDYYAESADLISDTGAPVKEVSVNHYNLIRCASSDLDLHLSKSTSPDSEVTESAPTEMKETYFIEVAQVTSVPEKEVVGNNPDSEQAETEATKMSRKASNPAFIAAQSKFEELSSEPTSTKLTSSFGHDLGVESGLDSVSSDTSAVRIGSECGTELSISSTLDSPDRSVNGIEHEKKVVSGEPEGEPKCGDIFEVEAIEKSPTLEADLSFTNTNDSKRYESSMNSDTAVPLDSINDEESPHAEKKQEDNSSSQQLDLESEPSPRSHITVPESQTTPSSQVSIKPKNIKGQKCQQNCKKKPSSAHKNCNQDSSSRSSLEQLPEHKSGKGRNSFGSSKPEHEPRENSSSSSLPSYMQATKSAKAKALLVANDSPRSSPDVYDKDIYIKKRHSLPGNNERQGSPRIQRSLSQAQQNANGNATNSPQDRKWRR